MDDFLALWKETGWGWALWNLRGDFGILDSGRTDVTYEDYKGHKLDRKSRGTRACAATSQAAPSRGGGAEA